MKGLKNDTKVVHKKGRVGLEKVEILEVTKGNLSEPGCFCLRSKPKSTGYQKKNRWLEERFDE